MAEEGIITYEKLYETLRNEKYKNELQKLDSDFFNSVVRYLDEKRSIIERLSPNAVKMEIADGEEY